MWTSNYMNGLDHQNLKNSAEEIIEIAKQAAVRRAVDAHVRSGQVVGVGTGSTAAHIASCIAEKVGNNLLTDLVCVPTSFQARHLIIGNGLQLSGTSINYVTLGGGILKLDLERNWAIDVCIDGADEVDPDLNCFKGGGGCLTQEKIVMSCSKKFVIVADYRKKSKCLGTNFHRLPLEVVPAAYSPVKRRVESTEGGICVLRMAKAKAGPVITDNGNYVLDWNFPKEHLESRDWAGLHQRLKLMSGMVETGLFIGVAEEAFFGLADGSVEVQLPKTVPLKRYRKNTSGEYEIEHIANGPIH